MPSESNFLIPQYWIAIVLALGACVLLFKPGSPGPLYEHSLRNFSIIYLLFGGLLGIPRLVWARKTKLWQTFLVALLALGLIIQLEVQSLLSARPELSISETVFLLTQTNVLVPFVIVFMTPLGITTSERMRLLTVLLIISPFVYVVATSDPGVDDFSRGFVVISAVAIVLLGATIGLPLFLLGRSLRSNSDPVAQQWLSRLISK